VKINYYIKKLTINITAKDQKVNLDFRIIKNVSREKKIGTKKNFPCTFIGYMGILLSSPGLGDSLRRASYSYNRPQYNFF